MSVHKQNNSDNDSQKMVVNLRSDTFTKPSDAMRQAMYNAEVGDDVCEEDPTVNKLQEYAAGLVGKEAALFVTSGSMGNLIATMVHCNRRGCEMYLGESSHMVLHEQGAVSQLIGVTTCTLPNNLDGTFNLKDVELKLRNPHDVHHPISRMIAVENTINGKVLPMNWLREVVDFAKKYNLKLHMDGARLWNAVAASKIDVKEIVGGFDSVTFCLSKGLGGPIGSILCGSKEFIYEARRCRKVLGGGMRQVGILAAAGFIALENRFTLERDHKNAFKMMEAINSMQSEIIGVNPTTVQTNMVFVKIKSSPSIDANIFVKRISETLNNDDDSDKIIIKAWAEWHESVRLVFHRDITDEMVEAAVKKIQYVIKELDPNLK